MHACIACAHKLAPSLAHARTLPHTNERALIRPPFATHNPTRRWVGGAIAFGGGIWATLGWEKAEQYFAGYLLEQSLSVDNLFVFLLVFGYFKTPEAYQGKVLQYGILTAAVLRAIFIVGGVELIQVRQAWVVLEGGACSCLTSPRMRSHSCPHCCCRCCSCRHAHKASSPCSSLLLAPSYLHPHLHPVHLTPPDPMPVPLLLPTKCAEL